MDARRFLDEASAEYMKTSGLQPVDIELREVGGVWSMLMPTNE